MNNYLLIIENFSYFIDEFIERIFLSIINYLTTFIENIIEILNYLHGNHQVSKVVSKKYV